MPSVLTPAGVESSPGIVPASVGISALTGDVTASGSGSVAATIPNTTVTLAKIANAAANSKLLGSGSAGSGSAYAELTLGTNLSMSGTTLNASGGGSGITELTGDVTAGPGSGSQAATITPTTGSGNFVKATSPTLVTPILGTPTSGNLSNCTALPVGSVTGLGSGVATFLATPSSANLATAVTDETGSGALVFATSPTLATPVLGTPTSGNLSNCTALPLGSVTGLGSNVSTFLATPSSANLAAALTDETGTGANVFANSPALTTPDIPSMTSGGKTITVPPATGTLPIIIKNSGTASGTTNSLTEANLVAILIPQGIMGTNGRLTIEVTWKYTGSNGARNSRLRHSTTSGDTSAGTSYLIGTQAVTAFSYRMSIIFWNANSASAQVSNATDNVNFNTSTNAPNTGAINTANDSYINLNGFVANAGDTVQVVGYTVTLYPGV